MENAIYTGKPLVEVAPMIFHAKFLTPNFCDYLLAICESHELWSTNKEDVYRTQDIYFEEHYKDLFDIISNGYNQNFRPKIQEYTLGELTDMYSIFAIKYKEGVQTSLKLHNDESYVSGSIKINNNYEGAELYFPWQDYSNKECEVGDILLWPGSLTHPHECKPLTSGTKYSLTLWSKYPENPLTKR